MADAFASSPWPRLPRCSPRPAEAGFLRFTSIPRDWEGNHTWVGWYRNGCSLSFEGKSFFACHLGHRWVIKTDSSNEICVPVSLVMQPWLPANKCSYY